MTRLKLYYWIRDPLDIYLRITLEPWFYAALLRSIHLALIVVL